MIVGLLCALLPTGFGPGHFSVPDAEWYLWIGAGNGPSVTQPFAARQLAPLAARDIAAVLGTSLYTGFFIVGVVSLLLLQGSVVFLAVRSRAPAWLLPLLAVGPFWSETWSNLVLPDLPYAALLAVLLLLLERGWVLAAAAMLFPLMVCRESTSLTFACLLVAGWRELRLRGAALALGSVAVGSLVVKHLSAGSRANHEALPQALYMFAKVPWNMLRTTGIEPWSNVYPLLCRTPRWTHPLHLGPVHAIGYCGYSAYSPAAALFALCTVFSVLPACTAVAWWRVRMHRRENGDVRAPLVLRFCLVYGALSTVLAPLVGVAYTRLLGYAWPLYLVALPLLFGEVYRRPEKRTTKSSDTLTITSLYVGQGVLMIAGARGVQAWSVVTAVGVSVFIWLVVSLWSPAFASRHSVRVRP